jgi:transcription termination factor NusB
MSEDNHSKNTSSGHVDGPLTDLSAVPEGLEEEFGVLPETTASDIFDEVQDDDSVTSPRTVRKRAFYVIFAAVSCRNTARETLERWIKDELVLPVDAQEILSTFDENKSHFDELIKENTTKHSIAGIPNSDLSIIYLFLSESKLGVSKKIILSEAASMADNFGDAPNSANFIFGVLSNAIPS